MIVCTYFIVKSTCSYTLCVFLCVCKQCHPQHRYRWVDICLPLHAFIPFFSFSLSFNQWTANKNGVWIATPTVTTSSFAELHSQVACGKNGSHIIQPKLKQTTVKATMAEGYWRMPMAVDGDQRKMIGIETWWLFLTAYVCTVPRWLGVSHQAGNTLQPLCQ